MIRIRCVKDGVITWLDADLLDYDAPYDLPGAPIGGDRAVDSVVVRHSGDNLPTTYVITATGHLHARTPGELESLYFRLKGLLPHADQFWRDERHLKLAGATLAGGEPLRGQTVVPAPIVGRVAELRWYAADGTPLPSGLAVPISTPPPASGGGTPPPGGGTPPPPDTGVY